MKYLFFILIGSLFVQAHCNEWFTVPMQTFNQVDYSTSTLIIQVSDGTLPSIVGSTSGDVGVNQINITPPSGKENAWLSMILSTVTTGAKIMVYGSKSGNVVTVASPSGKLSAIF